MIEPVTWIFNDFDRNSINNHNFYTVNPSKHFQVVSNHLDMTYPMLDFNEFLGFRLFDEIIWVFLEFYKIWTLVSWDKIKISQDQDHFFQKSS